MPAASSATLRTCVTEHAPVLNRAKQLYREKGCIGCHKFQGFDNQDEQLVSARQQIAQLENQKADDRLQIAAAE